MDCELRLPDGGTAGESTDPAVRVGADPAEIGLWLRGAIGSMPGEIVMARQAAAAVRRFAEAPHALVDRFAARLAPHLNQEAAPGTRDGGDALSPVLYGCAAEAVAEGQMVEAGVGLVALLARLDTRPKGLLGLAVCAARLSLFDDALGLALESRLGGYRHPRADYVAGLAELERGNRRAARLCLARSSRLARREPRHGDDLRRAQRLLLLMHMQDAGGLRKALVQDPVHL